MRIILALILSLFFTPIVNADELQHAKTAEPPEPATWQSPTELWATGDSWLIEAEMYDQSRLFSHAPTPEPPALMARSVIRIHVRGMAKVNQRECWIIDFTPEADAPKFYQGNTYRLWVGKKDGLAYRLVDLGRGEDQQYRLIKFDDLSIMEHSPSGFPLVLLPMSQSRTVSLRFLQLAVSVTAEEDNTLRNVAGTISRINQTGEFSTEESRVLQMWEPNTKWWQHYEEYYQGHLFVKARLLAAQ